MEGIVLPPGAGKGYQFSFSPGYEVLFKVVTDDAGGHFSMEEERVPVGFGGPATMHLHLTRVELFYVLEGEIEFYIGDQTTRAHPGTTVIVPKGVPHAYGNPGRSPAKQLAIWAPGGFEGFFHDVEQSFPDGTPFDLGGFVEIWRKYDTVPDGTIDPKQQR